MWHALDHVLVPQWDVRRASAGTTHINGGKTSSHQRPEREMPLWRQPPALLRAGWGSLRPCCVPLKLSDPVLRCSFQMALSTSPLLSHFHFFGSKARPGQAQGFFGAEKDKQC